MLKKAIFRAYDIRAVAMGENSQIDSDGAYLLGKAVGTYLQKQFNSTSLACGKDARLTSDEFQMSFIKGVLETGLNVTDLGLCPSPMLYYATCTDKFDCGVNVTASHNPKEYNGFKIVSNNAHSVCGQMLQEIYSLTQSGEFLEGNGKLSTFDISDEYFELLNSKVEIVKPIKIVVDSANAVTGPFLDKLFFNKNIEIIKLFDDLDGNFPNHQANPEKSENLKFLSDKVVEHNADFGIGFDGDGDRVGAVDENGKFYTLDLLLMILSRDFLSRNPGEKVIFDTKCSKVLENDIKKHGGVPVRYKTGHSEIEKYMHEHNIKFGGEMSGHYFFGEDYFGYDDAMFAALKICEIYAKSGNKYSDFFKDLPEVFNTPELRLLVDSSLKFDYIEKSIEFLKSKGLNLLFVDGAFVNYNDTTWAAIRASNTENKISCRFESQSKEELNEVLNLFIEMFEELSIPHVDVLKKYLL